MLHWEHCRTICLIAFLAFSSQNALSQQSSDPDVLIATAKTLVEAGTSAAIEQLLPALHSASNGSTNGDQRMWLLWEAGLLERKVGHLQDALNDFHAADGIVQQSNPAAHGVLTNNIALVYSDLGDSQRALAILDGELANTTDWNLKLIFYNTKGFILGQQGHAQEAVDSLNAAIASVPLGQINPRETELQRCLCEQYGALSSYKAALDHCQLALQSTHGEINSDYVSIQISSAEIKDAMGDSTGFKTELNSALTNAKTLNDDDLLLRAEVDLSTVYDRSRNYDNALNLIDAVLSTPGLASDARAVAKCNRSLILLHMGRFGEAKNAATEASSELIALGQPPAAATINLASVLVQTHSPSEAIKLLEDLKGSLGNNPNTHSWATLHDNLGSAYIEVFNLSKAHDEYAMEKTAAEALGDPRQLASAELGLANTSFIQRNYDETRKHAEHAIAQLQKDPDGFLEIKSRLILAAIGTADELAQRQSLTHLNSLAENANMRAVSTQVLLGLAILSRESNAQADGLQYAAKAYSNAQSVGDEEVQALALSVTASIYADQGKYSAAEPLFDQSIAHVEKWRAGAGADVFRTSLDNFLLLPFQDALSEAYKAQHFQRVFELAEEMKAKLLVERLHGGANAATITSRLPDQELKLRRQLEQLEADRTALWNSDATDTTTKQISDINDQLTKKRKDYDQLIQDISLQQPLRAVVLDSGRRSLSSLQQLVPGDTTLVDYVFVENHLMIFTVTRTTFDCKIVDLKQSTLKTQLETLRAFADLSSRPAVLSDLYAELVGPIRSLIHTKHLIVVPDGVVRDVPFAALYDGSGYLNESFSIANVATAKILSVTAPTLTPAASKYLLVSYSSPDGLQALPQADGEVKDIAGVFGTSAATDESRKNFLASAPSATVIHVAAHAQPDSNEPALSKLYLKPDHDGGTLTVFDIGGMELPKTRMVVLSACDSNVSTVNELDEAVGFTESFMEAGVPTVVSSLWLVSDATSRDLMKYFYTSVRNGERVDQSLADAQAKIRSIKPHPYYWAGFVVLGDGGKVF
jgi:CHAT domain-containing protein